MDKSEESIIQLIGEIRTLAFDIIELDGPNYGEIENETASFFDTEDQNEYWNIELVLNKHFKNRSTEIVGIEPNYRAHLQKLRRSIIDEINVKIRNKSNSPVLNLLNYCYIVFEELNNNIVELTITSKVSIHEISNKVYLPGNFDDIVNQQKNFRIGHLRVLYNSFYRSLADVVKEMLIFIKMKIGECKADQIETRGLSTTLQWKKSDTDLLELIVALNESGSIFCNNSAMKRTQTIEFFETLFGISIKDAESKLSKATDRKKNISPFLTSLKEAFDNYAIRKEQK
jgi:hypothetical protein